MEREVVGIDIWNSHRKPYRDPVVPNLRGYDWTLRTYITVSPIISLLRRYLDP